MEKMLSRTIFCAGVFLFVIHGGGSSETSEESRLSQESIEDVEVNDQPYHKGKKKLGSQSTSANHTKGYESPEKCDATSLHVPFNGNLTCKTKIRGCIATCLSGFAFPRGESEIIVKCRRGKWEIQDAGYKTVPDCERNVIHLIRKEEDDAEQKRDESGKEFLPGLPTPVCSPECQNSGICIANDRCDCPENFSGPQCQFEDKPCLNPPPAVNNAARKCSTKSCTVTCLDQFVFPDGSSVANLVCKHGDWQPTKSNWVTIPDCQPTCKPPCQNGGICLSVDACDCPQDFVGLQCQYRSDACSVSKLGFNGAVHCHSNDMETYVCDSLSCPAGIQFEFPPAEKYICHFATGEFEPRPVPQCLPPPGLSLSTTLKSHRTKIISHRNFSSTNISNESWKSGGWSMKGRGEGGQETSVVVKPQASTCFVWAGSHYKTFDGRVYTFDSNCGHTLLKQTDGPLTVSLEPSSSSCDTHQPSSTTSTVSASTCVESIIVRIQAGPNAASDVFTLSSPSATPGIDNTSTTQARAELRDAEGHAIPVPGQWGQVKLRPAPLGGLVVRLDGLGLKVSYWPSSRSVQGALVQGNGPLVSLEASESLWERVDGLCGDFNGHGEDDLADGPKDWRLERPDVSCEEEILWKEDAELNQDPGSSCSGVPEKQREANEFCSALLKQPRYEACVESIDFENLQAACRRDHCSCGPSCACDSMTMYAQHCAQKGIVSLVGWRNNTMCPMSCAKDKVYLSCAPKHQLTCGSSESVDLLNGIVQTNDQQSKDHNTSENCEEGCFCPVGHAVHEGKCIPVSDCPCRLRGKWFERGAKIRRSCNVCECEAGGRWRCSEALCAGRCSAIGDPHYTTFDGRRYDFMGACSYSLVKTANVSIEADNSVCSSSISQEMGLVEQDTNSEDEPTCTRAVTIRAYDALVKLKRAGVVLVNNEPVTKLPVLVGNGVRVRVVSSIFIGVELPDGLQVLWDGVTRVYVNAPAHFRGKTEGLCGTFTANQRDDFLTPDGDVEQSVAAFANKWKTNERCTDVKKELDHPCDHHPEKRDAAEKYCSVLKKNLFSGCHWHVDPEPFYMDCVYDMCACESSIETCLCPTLSAYAAECAQIGLVVPWRHEVHECRVHCSGDQEYQMCGSSCTRSCADISFHPECKEECVEGCNCPPGLTLDANGDCIPVAQCPCTYGGLEFNSGYREVRPGTKAQQLCTCAGGVWHCENATPEEILAYPGVAQLEASCNASQHQRLSTCAPAEPPTCYSLMTTGSNLLQDFTALALVNPNFSSGSSCRPGCVCKSGFVLDKPGGECVAREKCPCYHGGHSYPDGATVRRDCNDCFCSSGRWNCTDRICPGICSLWGDSHFSSFDDRLFDVAGVCEYVLSKGSLGPDESFSVTIRNGACGTTGVTCFKSLTFLVKDSYGTESVTLVRGKSFDVHADAKLRNLSPRRAGLFVFVDAPSLGLVLQWDEGTRVYLRASPRWRGRVSGLCGNYDGDYENDFRGPMGGPPETSAALFADAWRAGDRNCAAAEESIIAATASLSELGDTCSKRPERRAWAEAKCAAMKAEGGPFAACHDELEPGEFLRRCVVDACACDDGDDCDCVCTAMAAYAHECSMRGVPLRWRSQKLCPMQCDEKCSSYSACVPSCPRESCDSLRLSWLRGDDSAFLPSTSPKLCEEDACVEGCDFKPCPTGQVYSNGSHVECIERNECPRMTCLTIEGKQYFEGDRVSGDRCHSCHCTRSKLVCKGTPCEQLVVSTLPPPTVVTVTPASVLKEQTKSCTSGWTKWLNRDVPKDLSPRGDREELPTLMELLNMEGSSVCSRQNMIDIKCQTVDTKASYKEVAESNSNLDLECSLDKGLICSPTKQNQTCPDFELSVLCLCEGDESTTILRNATTKWWSTSTTQTAGIALKDECEISEPYRINKADCRKFVQCSPGPGGANVWTPKTCGPDMMFNEKMQVCDWPATVIALMPDCGDGASSTVITQLHNVSFVTTNRSENQIAHTQDWCAEGEYWDECAIRCTKTCGYFKHVLVREGICNATRDCVSGCAPKLKLTSCSHPDDYQQDRSSCVPISHCACANEIGEPLGPGEVLKISDCQSCQCVNNFYACDKSSCIDVYDDGQQHRRTHSKSMNKTSHELKISQHDEYSVIVVPNTISPARGCPSESNHTWLLELSAPNSYNFSASSNASDAYSTNSGQLRRHNSFVTWRPGVDDEHQWIQIELARAQPVYGIILGGDPFDDRFITSYKLLVSEDGKLFSYVVAKSGEPIRLSGPAEAGIPVKQMLPWPVEVKALRVEPVTWHKGIAAQIELIGCAFNGHVPGAMVTERPTTTPMLPIVTETVVEPVCHDRMGFNEGLMSDLQVLLSSSHWDDGKSSLRLSSPGVWSPLLDSPDQFVQFDFLEPRNLTGIETKGGDGIWTTLYKVHYSGDGKQWNVVIDKNGAERMFLANVDDHTAKINYFDKTIGARFIRIVPVKWHEHIGLKAEVLGCFVPYANPIPPVVITPVPRLDCRPCPGITVTNMSDCACQEGSWWNGRLCVPKQQCPCVAGHVAYEVGASFENAQCEQCVCALGGSPICHPKRCPICQNADERPVLLPQNGLCSCKCERCPIGTKLCPTSGDCVDERLWCNGVLDCPDDEGDDCPPYLSITTNANKTLVKQTVIKYDCQTTCPPGYVMVPQGPDGTLHPAHSHGNFNFTMEKTETYKSSYQYEIKTKVPAPVKKFQSRMGGEDESVCPDFVCKLAFAQHDQVTAECEVITCPEGFQPKYDQSKSYRKNHVCDNTCVPIPQKMRVCKMVGRTITTFDALEFKSDICNHILARDRDANRWYILVMKECDDSSCWIQLLVSVDEKLALLRANMSAQLDGLEYGPSELLRLSAGSGDQSSVSDSVAFTVHRVGDALRLEMRRYPVWLLLHRSGLVEVGASERLAGHVDGLCGYLDGLADNDMQTPRAELVPIVHDFVNSWIIEGSARCGQLQVCSGEDLKQAWDMCKLVQGKEFDACGVRVSRDHFVSRCVDASCACMARGASSSQCRCEALSAFVSECLSAPTEIGSKFVDLPAWRSIHDCPALCEAPFVYNDCFKNECEVSCENVRQVEPCPRVKDGGVCVSGCFCPEGLVRDGNNCVPAARCRDCACHGLGSGSSYVSFDGVNVRFEPNCTHLLSRDNAPNFDVRIGGRLARDSNETPSTRHTYQVWVSNGPCAQGLCAEALTVLYEWHVVQVKKGEIPDMLIGLVDGLEVTQLPYSNGWLTIEESPIRDVHIVIPVIQLELVIFRHNFAFILRLPSTTFGGLMDGICGDCDSEQQNDMKMPDGQVTDDPQEFGNSWQVSDALLAEFDNIGIDCRRRGGKKIHTEQVVNVSTCLSSNIEAEVQRCEQLVRGAEFSRCHGLIDPEPYYLACRAALCSGRDACDELHAYASLCSSKAGICIPWRRLDFCPVVCPAPLEYKACGSGCPRTCESVMGSSSSSGVVSTTTTSCAASESSAAQEGCFCPEDRVWLNGNCVPMSDCIPPPTPSPVCDEQGHVEGDTWMSDNCTSCKCLSGARIECERESCSAVETVCEPSSKPILVTGTESQCCPKYICVPEITATSLCNEAQQPECGFGQTLKISVDSDGCQNFICQCISEEECKILVGNASMTAPEVLEPGYVMTLNNTGCCPRYTKTCQPETCPTPPACQQFYNPIIKKDPDSCCPRIECEAPLDLCLISSISKNDVSEGPTLAKKIDESWEEDKCKTCTCLRQGEGLPSPICSVKECLKVVDHPDARDYLLKAVESSEQCCPIIERSACKDEDKIYQVGESWHPPGLSDACIQFECILDEQGVISKRSLVQQCNQSCEPGFEYRPPQPTSSNDREQAKCCGECVAYACSVEANEVDAEAAENETRLVPIGHSWRSLRDPCLEYSCVSVNGLVQIHSTQEICDDVSSLEESDYKLEKQAVSNQCCPKIVRTACLSEGRYYQPGEQWQSAIDSCIVGSCLKSDDGSVLKHVEMRTCNVDCPWAWQYQKPRDGECCGECKQAYCTLDGILYNVGQAWQSSDNCTTYSCDRIDDQVRESLKQSNEECFRVANHGFGRNVGNKLILLVISANSPVCPQVDCPPELVYTDGCCKKCKIFSANKTETPPCATEVLDFDSTVGLVVIKDGPHGSCKNLQPVLGLTECRGNCDSSTRFDSITWEQVMNCRCCQPTKYRKVKTVLTCDDGEKLNKTLSVPEVCSCKSCSPQDSQADSLSVHSEHFRARRWLMFG